MRAVLLVLLLATAAPARAENPTPYSGTQVIAAENVGRRCFGMDIDPAYTDVTCRRWLLFTGDEPVHESTGRTFSEMTDGQDDT